ncbi:hypothetical protein HpNP141_05210 [Helicobacter pylori]|nr:hypothetical protein KVK10_00410 [Helicobacter pylori]WRA61660.1 hypothetical protein KVL21_00400 [Helicobacter pylori]
MQAFSRQALSKLKDDKIPLFRLENAHAGFKEPFILAFVRAKAPCFRRFYTLDAQN